MSSGLSMSAAYTHLLMVTLAVALCVLLGFLHLFSFLESNWKVVA